MAGSAPTSPDPTTAAIAGIQQQTADYPFSYLVNSLAQTGGNATLTNPATGQPQNYDFTNLGTAQVQNQVSSQMAGVLLGIQQGLGSQYIAQRLADLKLSDPTGYAAYGQLFDKIQQEAAQNPPDMPLSQQVQSSINGILQNSNTLSPSELQQVQQQANATNAASGILLGNAPAQAVGTAAVNAVDQQNNQAQAAASQYLQQGTTPSDIQYRTIQQNMQNLGAFINGQNPTAEFSSLSGAQNGAAPTPATGYQAPTLNEQQGAAQGIGQAQTGFAYQNELAQNTANPYLAGLSMAVNGIGTANQISQYGNNFGTVPNTATNPFYLGGATPSGSTPASQLAGLTSEAGVVNQAAIPDTQLP